MYNILKMVDSLVYGENEAANATRKVSGLTRPGIKPQPILRLWRA